MTRRFDRVFWFGDFNFRVNKSRAEVDKVFVNRSFEDRNERKKFIIDVSICSLLYYWVSVPPAYVNCPSLRIVYYVLCYSLVRLQFFDVFSKSCSFANNQFFFLIILIEKIYEVLFQDGCCTCRNVFSSFTVRDSLYEPGKRAASVSEISPSLRINRKFDFVLWRSKPFSNASRSARYYVTMARSGMPVRGIYRPSSPLQNGLNMLFSYRCPRK